MPLKPHQSPITKRPPSRFLMLLETRALIDLASIPLSLIGSKFSSKNAEGALPIIMFPGFGYGESYFKPLEHYLRNLGYSTEGWGLGRNLAGLNLKHTLEDLSPIWEIDYPEGYTPETYKGEAGVPFLCDKAIECIKKRSDELGVTCYHYWLESRWLYCSRMR